METQRIDVGYHSKRNGDPRYEGPGWYFYDEAEQINGPFDSAEDARAALAHYIKNEL